MSARQWRICSEMLWMHHLVGISHFAKYDTNRSLILWEMLTNVQQSSVPQWLRKWKSDPESTHRTGSPPKVNHFWRVIHCPCLPSLVDVRFRVRQLSCLQNDKTNERTTENDHITSAILTEVIIIIIIARLSTCQKKNNSNNNML